MTTTTDNVLPALTLLSTSPVLKPEDAAVLHVLIGYAQQPGDFRCTMFELLEASQHEEYFAYFRHPVADALTREFIGELYTEFTPGNIVETSVEFTGDGYRGGYHVWLGDIEFYWSPARFLKESDQQREQRKQQEHDAFEEFFRDAMRRAEAREKLEAAAAPRTALDHPERNYHLKELCRRFENCKGGAWPDSAPPPSN